MLASHAWLMELTGLSLDPAAVAERFTAAGLEVEGLHRRAEGLQHVVIAEVRAIRPHPKRDKLRLVTVFDGSGEQEVVCGAPNVPAPGGRVVLAKLGARLPDGLEITPRDLGGITSAGMLCSERELDATADAGGIIVLAADDAATPGSDAARVLGLRDTIYELSLTPNRPDCLGHVGLARELCALFGARFAWPSVPFQVKALTVADDLLPQRDAVFELPGMRPDAGESGFRALRIDIEDGARCPRYGAALVAGVQVGPSPFWLRHRLHRLGQRSINNIVDTTNYVLLLFGHPIHGFDYEQLRGSRIVVRQARPAERMRTLDGVERELSADDLLICDGDGPVALAGVMGGEGSQINDATQRVLIECAYFDPRSVRRTSKRTGLHTDSSHRFERGVDPSDVREVLAYASALIAQLGGGCVLARALDCVAQPIARAQINLRMERVATLLGQSFEPGRAAALLRGLGCELSETQAGFDVKAPTHRPDLTREVDLIEELSRLAGYDSLPSVLPRITPSPEGTPEPIRFVRRLREAAVAAGLLEALNYAFVARQDLELARASQISMRVVNPISEERSVMRTSLLPGLSANLRLAQHQQLKGFAQFELARVFFPRAGELLPDEQHQLGVLLWGERRAWYGEGDLFDFYDAKGVVVSIVQAVTGRAPETRLDAALESDSPELHPRRCARLYLGERPIGVIGELHPDVVNALGLEGRPLWVRVDVAELAAARTALGATVIAALPRFPSTTRDLAVLVPETLPAGDVEQALRAAAGPRAEAVVLFDIYRGEPVPQGSKSLAFHVVYRDLESTLTDKVVDALHAKVTAVAEKRFGGSVRR